MEHPSPPKPASSNPRRRLLAAIAACGGVAVTRSPVPDHWSAPRVESVLLPAHAQTTSPGGDNGPSPNIQVFSEIAPITIALSPGGLSHEQRLTALGRNTPSHESVGVVRSLLRQLVTDAQAQANPELEAIIARAYARLDGDVAELLQVRISQQFRCGSDTMVHEFVLLLEFYDVPVDGGFVLPGFNSCSELPSDNERVQLVSSHGAYTAILDSDEGPRVEIPLQPGGSPFAGVPHCSDQFMPADCLG